MTALAGYWDFSGPGEAVRQCERMLAAQQIYGPEPAACRSDGGISLGRRLFPLLPEDRYDRGPSVAAGGSRLLVADIRLDNRDELCAALAIPPAEAARMADAAVLMRALDRWDEEAVARLVGDFAFALWDGARQRLLLARDFSGQRPLHYHRGSGWFAFASMPKGLHALPAVPRAPDRQAMADFLALIPDTGTESFFEGVEKVLPGHLAVVTREGIASRRYWDPPRRELRLRRDEDYEEALREQLDRAVACRLRGVGGAVASHLSAGLDSSAVTATAARLLAPAGGRVSAYTAVPREGFDGEGPRHAIADEGPLAARLAADYPNIDHVRISSSARTPFDDVERYFHLYERPMLNLCNAAWATAILDDAKARRLPILLTGQMGNMSFSYDGMLLLPQLLRQGKLWPLAATVWRLLRNRTRAGTVAAATIGPYVPGFVWRKIRQLRGKSGDLSGYSAISPGCVEALGLRERAAQRALDPSYRPRRDAHETRLWALRRVDHGNYGKGTLGGWGIDMRDPTADRRLFEFCLSVPLEQYLAGGVPRSLARRAFADRVPSEVLQERRKGYQAADWYEGLAAGRPQLADEVARMEGLPQAEDTLDLPAMRQLIHHWPSGGWNDNRVMERYRLALLRGVSAGHFIRKASGSNR